MQKLRYWPRDTIVRLENKNKQKKSARTFILNRSYLKLVALHWIQSRFWKWEREGKEKREREEKWEEPQQQNSTFKIDWAQFFILIYCGMHFFLGECTHIFMYCMNELAQRTIHYMCMWWRRGHLMSNNNWMLITETISYSK